MAHVSEVRADLVRAPRLDRDLEEGRHGEALLDQETRHGRLAGLARLDLLAAVTRFLVKERFSVATLLEVTIETGRTHQIRAHLAHVGHPVLGDPRQGGAGELARRIGLDRLFLHAGVLEFAHGGVEPRRFEETLPEDLARALVRVSSIRG